MVMSVRARNQRSGANVPKLGGRVVRPSGLDLAGAMKHLEPRRWGTQVYLQPSQGVPMRYGRESLHSARFASGTYIFANIAERLVMTFVDFWYPEALVKQNIP